MRLTATLLVMAAMQVLPQHLRESEWRPAAEQRILARLKAIPEQPLKCDFVLNAASAASFAVPVHGRTTILNFWRPSCGPCKPLLTQLTAMAKGAPADLAILSAAEGGSPYGGVADPVKARDEIDSIVHQHSILLPVCGYTDHAQTKRWQAEGVPLTLFYGPDGTLRRVALGADEGSRAIEQLRNGWRP